MQPWQGQSGGDDNNSWQQNYNFSTQNGQFNPNQNWQQPISGQTQNDFARQLNPSDSSANLFHDPSMLSGYSEGHGTFDLNQHFNGQEVIDPAFSNVHSDLYAQQNKMDMGGNNMHHLGQAQGHSQGQPQSFAPQAFNTFDSQPQHGQQFNSSTPQYSQAQLLPQTSRQQSHTPTPTQQFSSIQPNFATQLRPTHTPPAQQRHQQFQQNNSFATPQVNGHGAQYQQGQSTQLNYEQSSAYGQPNYSASQFQPPPQQSFTPPVQHQQGDPSLGQQGSSQNGTPQPQSAPFEQSAQSSISEGPAKKRQRINKPAPAAAPSPVPEVIPQSIGSPIEPIGKKMEELDALVPPISTPEEIKVLNKFQKRGKAAQAKFPTAKGLPHLAQESTIKLPAPKSYDKLVPLVAVPSRSRKPINSEAGHDLPSEIQGRFTSQYRPAFDRIGLDERRLEASSLLDDFDRSMKSLGKKRPKYTEYPHSFKEQLKADEAFKNKKAKREQEVEKNKPVRPAQRPSDPVEGTAWDIVGIVHFEPNATKTSSIVAQRVQQAGDFFIKLRGDVNRMKQEVDKAVEEKKPEPEVAQLKNQHETSREALHRAFDATIEHADDSVMDNLGANQKLVQSLVNVLIACIKAADFKGKLPKVVLELFTHFPMTKKIAETTNFDTVRKRFLEKGDDELKELVREITKNVKKMKQAEESTGYTGTSSASRAKTVTKPAASGKRARDEDGASDGRTVKKVAVDSGNSALSKKLAQPKLSLTSASKNPAAKASSTLIDRARPAVKPATRPESIARAESPDDKIKAKKTAVKVETAKIAPTKASTKPPAPQMGAAPSSSALSGIGSLLASINTDKPKTPPSAAIREVKGEPDGPETAEEKAKRLRKESRRKLRVSWKPESELVETRIFEKEDDEDEGRDSNMIRDAADDKSEGMVLKQRGRMEDEDEDEDEIMDQPWTVPYLLDLSPLEDQAKQKNYATRGGDLALTTEEQQRIRERENSALMAIYATVDDIPPTPKSPGPESSTQAVKVVHLPQDGPGVQEIQNRWRDADQMGPDGAFYTASSRLNARVKTSPLDNILGSLQGVASQQQAGAQKPSAAHAVRGGNDMNVPLVMGPALAEECLAWLRSDKAKSWLDPNPSHSDPARVYNYVSPSIAAIGAFLEPICQALADKPYPATMPPEWLKDNKERTGEWWTGYLKEAAIRQKRMQETERARAAAKAATQQAAAPVGQDQATQEWLAWYAQQPPDQQQAYAPYLAALQQMNGGQNHNTQAQPPPQVQAQGSQMAALLSAMGQPPQPPPGQGGYDPSYQGGQPHYTSSMDDRPRDRGWGAQDYDHEHDRDNDRDWDRRDRGYEHDDEHGRGHKGKNKDKKPGPSTIHKPPNASLIGTKPCTFWQQGKCARGDKCTFRHD